MLDFVFKNQTQNRQFNKKFFEALLLASLKELKLEKKNVGLSLNLVSSNIIQGLNKQFRKKDKPTDVLSFPLNKNIPRISLRNNVSQSILELGDIFICISVAREKAREEKKSIRAELAFLTTHGLLHLCGYDHEKSEIEKKKMFGLQDKILNKFTL